MTTNIKALTEKILARYERTRRMCLRYGNRHPDSDAVCHQAITGTHNVDGFAKFLALELDDMKLDTEQLASALLRVLEDAERLSKALSVTHRTYFHDPNCAVCMTMESHNKLMEELGGE